MSDYCFRKTHVHRATLLVAIYAFVLSLLDAQTFVHLIFNVSSTVPFFSDPDEENSVANVARRVYSMYHQFGATETRGLMFLNAFAAGFCCALLAYANRNGRPSHYWPFFGFCLFKILHCCSEVLDSTLLMVHKVTRLPTHQQSPTIHFIGVVGIMIIVSAFLWAYFLDISFRSKRFLERQLRCAVVPNLRPLPPLYSTAVSSPAAATTRAAAIDVAPPPFDWKPGDSSSESDVSRPPAYQP